MHRHYDPSSDRHHHGPGRPRSLRSRLGWLLCLAVAVAAGYVATGFYSVQPGEKAIVRRCGRALPGLRGPGLHFGFPWGIDKVARVKMLERKRVGVGVGLLERAQGRRIKPQQVERLTGDRNLVLISAIVQYEIADAKAYLFQAGDVPALIESSAASALSSIISSMNVDDVLTVQRVTIQNEVRRVSQEAMDGYGVGVRLTAVSLEQVKPPADVADAFRDVTSAREDRQRTINEALGYANQLIPQARGRAQEKRFEAEALADGITQTARGDADRFKKIVAELSGNRRLTAQRLTLETMEKVLPRLRKIVLDGQIDEDLDLGLFEEDE